MSLESPGGAAIPPHVTRYLAGAPEEAGQFGFLIGDWSVRGARYDASGAVELRYQACWRAQYLHDKRMVLDDFVFLSPSGKEVSSFVTLRTYAPLSGRWEIAGLAALEPGLNGQWNGRAVGAEMHLDAEIRTPDGRVLHNKERFSEIDSNSFRWESSNSNDNRATWTLASALVASRVS